MSQPPSEQDKNFNACLGCMGCLGLIALGGVCLACMGMFVSWRTQESIQAANTLYNQGKQAEAVTAYKGLYPGAGADKQEILRRIVRYEVAHGNTKEASQWIERGLQDNLVLAFDDPAGQQLAEAVKKDFDERVAREKREAEEKVARERQEREAKAKAEQEKREAEERNTREEEVRNAVRTDAPRMLASYEANAVAADERYKDRLVEVQGVVDHVGKDFDGDPFVALKGGGDLGVFNVQCFFGAAHAPELAAVRPGDGVTIRGRCMGKVLNVVVGACEFVRPSDKPAPKR